VSSGGGDGGGAGGGGGDGTGGGGDGGVSTYISKVLDQADDCSSRALWQQPDFAIPVPLPHIDRNVRLSPISWFSGQPETEPPMTVLLMSWSGVTHSSLSFDQLCFCELESISHSV